MLPTKQRRDSPPKTLKRDLAAIEREAVNESSRTATLSFASEQPVNRWFGQEILRVDTQSVDLSRFNNGLGCLLFNHNRDAVIGKIIKAWVDDVQHKAYADVQFDTDEESERIYQKVLSGTLKGDSVGYGVDESNWENVPAGKQSSDGRFTGPSYVALRWMPYEISIVSVPADDSVGVGRDLEENENESEERNMDKDKEVAAPVETRTAPVAPAAPAVDADAIRTEAIQRSADIVALCRDFDMNPEPFVRDAKKTVADVQTEILRQLKEKNKPSETTRASIGEEDAVKFSRAAVDAILIRDGFSLTKPADGATELRSMRLRDLMIECLERGGNSKARHLNDQDMIREALTGTGAFAGILSNAANKSMSEGYAAADTTFEQWTGTGSNPDFKAATHYRLSEAGDLEVINQGGEFKHDEATEEGVTKSVLTFGRTWSLTRQAIINDDLSALTRLPQRYAAAARRGVNKLAYQTLVTSSIYSSPHGNLAGSAAALSVASIGAGRAAMRKQKNLRAKETLNIAPKFLIVPAAIETVAEQLLASISDPDGSNSNVKNPFAGKLQLVCDAELDSNSLTAWYLAVQAGLVDTIEVTYLNGQTSPFIESQVAFDVLGMKWRIYHDYGVTNLDYRGLYKNAGA
ncbi:MAG: prohead protease/major capsid protein fusion protein [Negativicutes bacterium]